jgi:3-oxoacyl-[acyl-carrier protein] reductase
LTRLEGKVALVTGASRGIGAAVCRGFAQEGAGVAINHLSEPAREREAVQLAAELREGGARAVTVAADVSRRDQVEAMVARVEEELGPVDVLVANAAATGQAPWTSIDEEEWRRVTAVNIDGALFCCQAVHAGMRRRGRGKIITVSSVMAALGAAGALHYVTSKAALIGFTRALAREVGGEGICVNCVMPGGIRTEQELELFPGQEAIAAHQAEVQSIPRRGVAEDLVGAFVFLASAESDFVTGQVLNVDGGWVNY